MSPDVQHLVAALQDALGLKVTCGSITLNLNEALLQSVKTETHLRVKKPAPPVIHGRDNRAHGQ